MLGGTGNVRETLASVVIDVICDDDAVSRRGVASRRFALLSVAFTPLELRVAVRRTGSLKEETRIARW